MNIFSKIIEPFRSLTKSWGEAKVAKMIGHSGTGAWGYGTWGGTWDRQELANHYKGFNYLAIQPLMKEIGGMTPHAALRHDGFNVRQETNKAMVSGDWQSYRQIKSRFLSPYERQKAIAPIQTHEELEPIPNDHPLIRLLRNPNGPDTAATFFRKLIMFWRLYGEFYIWLVPPKLERLTGIKQPPVEMWVLPSHWVWPKHDPEYKSIFKEFEIRPYAGAFPVETGGGIGMSWFPGGSGRTIIPADQVVYYGEPNPSGFLNGYSPLTAISHWIDCSDSIDRSRTAQFQNGAFPGVVVEFDKSIADPPPDMIQRLEARIAGAYAGVKRTGKSIILAPGVKMRPLDNKPYEMAYTESAEQIKDWVFAAQGTGQSIVGLVEQTTFNNVWGARANFYSNTIKPTCQLLGELFTEKIGTRFDKHMVVYWPDTTPVDPDLRLRELDTMLKNNVLTPNEVCSLMGYEPKPWGDKPLDQLKFEYSQPGGQPGQPGQPNQPNQPESNPQKEESPNPPPATMASLVNTAKPMDESLSVSPLHNNGSLNGRLKGSLKNGLVPPSPNGKHRSALEQGRLR